MVSKPSIPLHSSASERHITLNMKVYWMLVATWFCWTMIFGSARIHPLTANIIASFSTTGSTTDYSNFLKNIRDNLKASTSNGIPVLAASVASKDKLYTLVQLSNSGNKQVTLALRVTDLYVVAYKEGSNAYFFSDAYTDAKDYVFNDKGIVQTKLTFTGSYGDLADRLNTALGKLPLDEAIFGLSKQYTQKDKLAGPLVVVVQMVSEAARFTYIERTIVTNFGQRFKPLYDVTSRQNAWGKLSDAIQNAKANGDFKTAVQLRDSKNSIVEVKTIAQAKPDMGILLYVKKSFKLSFGEGTLEDDLIQIQNILLPSL